MRAIARSVKASMLNFLTAASCDSISAWAAAASAGVIWEKSGMDIVAADGFSEVQNWFS